jgi:hypothetical protein
LYQPSSRFDCKYRLHRLPVGELGPAHRPGKTKKGLPLPLDSGATANPNHPPPATSCWQHVREAL